VTLLSTSRNDLDKPSHKTVSGLRPSKSSAIAVVTQDSGSDSDADAAGCLRASNVRIEPSVRQCHSDTRFPQRKKPMKSTTPPTLQPSTIDKLISGIWRQVHSPITLSVSFPVHFPMTVGRHDLSSLTKVQDRRPEFNLRTGVSQAVRASCGEMILHSPNHSAHRFSKQSMVYAKSTMTRAGHRGLWKW
jgi:hypothetical protein